MGGRESPRQGVGEKAPAPNRLGDHTGRHFEEGVEIQAPAQGSPGGKNERGARRGDRPIPMAWGWSLDAA